MTPQAYFNQAESEKVIPNDAKIQNSYQFGVNADELAQLVIDGIKTATASGNDLYSEDPLPAKLALKEGEGDRTLRYWRTKHEDFFNKDYKGLGKTFDETTARVVLETFHVVYTK